MIDLISFHSYGCPTLCEQSARPLLQVVILILFFTFYRILKRKDLHPEPELPPFSGSDPLSVSFNLDDDGFSILDDPLIDDPLTSNKPMTVVREVDPESIHQTELHEHDDPLNWKQRYKQILKEFTLFADTPLSTVQSFHIRLYSRVLSSKI